MDPSIPPVPPVPLASPAPADPHDAEDRALLLAVAAGDRAALSMLYQRNAGWLIVRLQRRCADPELVDSALQDTFVAVWRSAGSFGGRGDAGAWMWGIALHKLVDQQRRRRPVPADPAQIARTMRAVDPTGSVTASAEHAALGASIQGGDLADALAALPPELRAVMVATVIDGLTTGEAARLLGIPQGTVKTRAKRARELLQEHLR